MSYVIHKRVNHGAALCGIMPQPPETATSRSAHVSCRACLDRQKINRAAAKARFAAAEAALLQKETA